ncbi:MarR family winged helix-turn-helix transcriptional regulator [Pusillimonas sp.]|uniref:MarR family winged helix-turn-helix transcriptional regulator n=1 Tax=Pusillimonas sp. TaxID=3040095 RepID=UPI0037C8B805
MTTNKASVEQQTSDLLLDQFIPFQLVLLSGYFGDELLKIYSAFDLTLAEWRVVACVASGKCDTAIEIANSCRLDEVAIHRAVTELVRRGFLRRAVDERDRRRKPLRLTDKGLNTHSKIVPKILAFEASVLEKLNADERAMLRNALNTLCERLELAR